MRTQRPLLLPALLLSNLLLLFACCPYGSAAAAAATPAACASAGGGAQVEALRDALQRNLKVIFVIDPNSDLCWERIPVNALSSATLLRWAGGLRDVLTATAEEPGGELLRVRTINSTVTLLEQAAMTGGAVSAALDASLGGFKLIC